MAEMAVPGSISATRKPGVHHARSRSRGQLVWWLTALAGMYPVRMALPHTILVCKRSPRSNYVRAQGQCPSLHSEANHVSRPTDLERASRRRYA
jgi:hypothetical protein